jgi:hypothetical protein
MIRRNFRGRSTPPLHAVSSTSGNKRRTFPALPWTRDVPGPDSPPKHLPEQPLMFQPMLLVERVVMGNLARGPGSSRSYQLPTSSTP